MPRRWGTKTRTWAYRFLVLRDGELCARCFEIPTTLNALDIDHINGIPWDDDPDNLRLLCRRCNVTLENQARVTRNHKEPPSDQRESEKVERERREGQSATRIVREEVNYRQGEVSMQANALFEVSFRSWLIPLIREGGHYLKTDAVAAGAEQVGCSPLTTSRYLAKLTSSSGPLEEVKDLLGNMMLQLKAHLREEPRTILNLDPVPRSQAQQGQRESARPHQPPGLFPESGFPAQK